MIRIALLLTLTACGTRQATPTTPDATPVVQSDATPATLPSGTRTATPNVTPPPEAPASAAAIIGLLNAHHTADLPDRSTLDAHDDAVGSLIWVATYGDPLAVRGRAMRLLGQYSDESAVQTQRDAVASTDAHPILVAAGIRGLTDRGLADDDTSVDLILKREGDIDERVAAAVVAARDSLVVD